MDGNKAHAAVLAALESVEAQQINLGLYATQVTPETLYNAIKKTPDAFSKARPPSDASEVEQILRSLAAKGEAIEWMPNLFRSRIAETVRILRLLRQRVWRHELHVEDPLLVEDIRVEFRQRIRPVRVLPIAGQIPVGVNPSVARALEESLIPPSGSEFCVSGFQAKAMNEIFSCALQGNEDNRSFIVAGDTGAGKTEAFFFPILLDIACEPAQLRVRQGVRAVLVYPRIRLARNQLSRLLRYTTKLQKKGAPPITLGVQIGDVPDSAESLGVNGSNKGKRWHSKVRNGRTFYRVELLEGCFNCKPGCYWVEDDDPNIDRGCPRLVCDHCGDIVDTLYITQSALKCNAPDILIITDISLSQWLAREQYSHLWGLWTQDALGQVEAPTPPPRFLVLDEVHLYEQLKGAHIARLIKRFQARVRLIYDRGGPSLYHPTHHPVVIGVSATLHDERAFLAKLLDVNPADEEQYNRLQCIKPQPGDSEPTGGRERYIFIYPRNLSPTPSKPENRVDDQTAAIQILMAAVHNLMSRDKKWRALAFFDSINDLRQFSHNYDDPDYGSKSRSGNRVKQIPPANQDELWRIRTDRIKSDRSKRVLNKCGIGCSARSQASSLHECPHFQSGDCWVFAKTRGCNRVLKLADPVYAGARAAALDSMDLIPSSPSLEVGYDDEAIQLVYQHKAPANAVSFIQRRGRAGRDPEDSPVIITLLWPYRRDDAFYFFRPEALYEPTFDDVPLNAGNFTVQRTHTLLAFFDLLACWRRQDISNIRAEERIADFSAAGWHHFPLSSEAVRSSQWKNNGKELVLWNAQTGRRLPPLRGKQISDRHVEQRDGTIFMRGWLAMEKDLLPHVLLSAWEKLNAHGDLDSYIRLSEIASRAFREDRSYPFLPNKPERLPEALGQFGRKEWHSSNENDWRNWLKTYHHIDWQLQGSQETTTLTVHYPATQGSRILREEELPGRERRELSTDVTFALTEFLPGNVSYRLREENAIHWTPIPREGESTFLYPRKAEGGDDDPEYFPKKEDIAGQANSIFGISTYLYKQFPDLQFFQLNRLRVVTFGVPNESSSTTWYFVPNEKEPNKGYAIEHKELDAKRVVGAFQISRRSTASANSAIVPFIADSRYGPRRLTLSPPLNILFSSVEGFLEEGRSLLGYYRVFYGMDITVKGSNQSISLHRHFYGPGTGGSEQEAPKPVMVGYRIKTQGICFQINPNLIEQAVGRLLNDEDLRLSLRRNFTLYQIAPKSAEWDLFIKTQLERAEVAVDYWLHEVATQPGEPRLLEASRDKEPLLEYYRTCRIVRPVDVEGFREFLTNHSDFFESLNSCLESSFRKTPAFRKFVTSVILHSLAALLKNLVARLGGLGSDELVAYIDLPILERVDSSIYPRILIMDTVEGGSGG
ncbi:hypothetical protein KSC_002640 [Ktedonobacter sp. SOSP1-52]|uniref:DEAD/DEAH box helicase n=1 Tax=Ktedonobacter sp. SOSP1-52 TaxID=2778366 RepID=UPI001915C6A8|nr:DEAD/DEAH box helicase [Ktedonobacter sp. SOSP1-52]GHO61372.1 hypothetical protein KSC_002640 [Ktedonobacter sp. SOSP1-52]